MLPPHRRTVVDQVDIASRRAVDDVHVRTCNEVPAAPRTTDDHGRIIRWCSVDQPTCNSYSTNSTNSNDDGDDDEHNDGDNGCRSTSNTTNSGSSATAKTSAWVYFLDPSDPELVVRENQGEFPSDRGVDGVSTWSSWQAQLAAARVSIASLHEVATRLDIVVLTPRGLMAAAQQARFRALGASVVEVDDFGVFPGYELSDGSASDAPDATTTTTTSATRTSARCSGDDCLDDDGDGANRGNADTDVATVRQLWGGRWTGRAAMARRRLHALRLTQYQRVAVVSSQLYFTKNIDDRILLRKKNNNNRNIQQQRRRRQQQQQQQQHRNSAAAQAAGGGATAGLPNVNRTGDGGGGGGGDGSGGIVDCLLLDGSRTPFFDGL